MPPKVRVELPSILQPFCSGDTSAMIEGGTVAECLANLVLIHPGLKTALFKGSGELDSLWLITLDHKVLKPDSLDGAVTTGQTIRIMPIAAGG